MILNLSAIKQNKNKTKIEKLGWQSVSSGNYACLGSVGP
jgi:hypothetical protein